MEWAFLVIAGGLEVFWSTCMKYSNGFTEIKYTVLTIIGMVFSFIFYRRLQRLCLWEQLMQSGRESEPWEQS